jgi:hypothetical protein
MKNFTRLSFALVVAAALAGAGCEKRDGTGAAPGATTTSPAPMSSASAASQ